MGPMLKQTFWNSLLVAFCIIAFALHPHIKGSASACALQVQVPPSAVCTCAIFTGEFIANFYTTGELLPKILTWQNSPIFQSKTGEPIAKFPLCIFPHTKLHFCDALGARNNSSIGWQSINSSFPNCTQVCISGLNFAHRDNHFQHGMDEAFARCVRHAFPYHARCGSAAVRVAVAEPGQGWAPCTNQSTVRVTCGSNCASTPGAVTGMTAPLQVNRHDTFSPLTTAELSSDNCSVLLSFQSGGTVCTLTPPTQCNPYLTGSLSLEESVRISATAHEGSALKSATPEAPINPFVATPGGGGKELEWSLTAGVRIEGPSPGYRPEPGWVSSPPAVPYTHSHICLHNAPLQFAQRSSWTLLHFNDQLSIVLIVTAFLLTAFLLWVNSPEEADVCICEQECVVKDHGIKVWPSGKPYLTASDMCIILCTKYGRWVKGTKYVGEIPRRSARERAEQHWSVGVNACNWCRKPHVDDDCALRAYNRLIMQRRIMLLLSLASCAAALLTVHLHFTSCSGISSQGATPAFGCTSVSAFHRLNAWLATTVAGPYFNPLPQGVHSIMPQTRPYGNESATCHAASLQASVKPSLSRSLALLLGDYPLGKVLGEREINPNSAKLTLFETYMFTIVRALGAGRVLAHPQCERLRHNSGFQRSVAANAERLPEHTRFLELLRMATSSAPHVCTGRMWAVILATNAIFFFSWLPLLSVKCWEKTLSVLQCYAVIVRGLVVSILFWAWPYLTIVVATESAGFDCWSHILSHPAFAIVALFVGALCECAIASINTAWLRLERLCYLSLAARFEHLDDAANDPCVDNCAGHGCKDAHAHAPDGSCCEAHLGRTANQCQGGLETHPPAIPLSESVPVHEGAQECGGTAGQGVGQQGHGYECTSGGASVQSSSDYHDYSRAYRLLALLFSVAAVYCVATEPGLSWSVLLTQCFNRLSHYCPIFTVIGSLMGRLVIGVTGEFSALFVTLVLFCNLRGREPAKPAHVILLNADYSRQSVTPKHSDWVPHTVALFVVSVLQQMLQRYPELLQEAYYFGVWNTASCVLVALMLLLCPIIVHGIELINRMPLYIVATIDSDQAEVDSVDDECESDNDVPSCVVMTGAQDDQGAPSKRQENWTGDYPRITAQGGIALLRQLDAFRRACLQQHCKRPQEESVYVMALRDSCPDPSSLHTLLRDKRPELGDKTPIEHSLKIADDNFVIWRDKVASGEIKTGRPDHMAEVLENFYPAYEPSPQMVRALAELEAERQAEDTTRLALREAERGLQRLGANLVQEKLEHDSRTPMQKYAWMLAHPEYSHLCKQIKNLVELARSQERDRQDALGGKMVAMQASQFREIDDFKALNWLQAYILDKLATITASNVTLFNKMKMLPGETPRQAHAKAYREAELIKSAKVTGFIIPVAIYRLLTNEKQEDGGTFFPEALVEATKSTITTLEFTMKIPEDDHEARTRIMIDVMDRQWKDICTSPDGKLSIAIRRQLQIAKALAAKNEAEFHSHELPRAPPKADGKQTAAPSGAPAPAAGGKFHCIWHDENDTHDTAHCKLVAHSVREAKAARAKAAAEKERKHQEASAATLQREHAADGGIRPGSGLDRQMQREAAEPNKDGMVVCDFCSKIAKREIRHKPGCFLKGDKKPYDGWAPFDNLLLAFYNSMRAQQGLPPVQPQPKPPAAVGVLNLVEQPNEATEPAPGTVIKRTKVHFSDEVVTAAIVADRPATYIVATLTPLDDEESAIRLNLALQGDEAMDRFSFNAPARTFTCRACASRGVTEVSGGILLSLSCTRCETKFMYTALPQEWRGLALWLQDPSILSESLQQRLGMRGGTAAMASPATKTDSSISFARVGSEPYTPHKAHEVKVSHAETMSYLDSARVYPNYDGGLSTMNSSALAVILGDYGATGQSSYAHRLDAIFNDLPDQVQAGHRERITKAVRRYNASKTAKDMVAAGSSVHIPKADPPRQSGDGQSLRSNRLHAAIDPVVSAAPSAGRPVLPDREAEQLTFDVSGSQVKPETVAQVSRLAWASPAEADRDNSGTRDGHAHAAAGSPPVTASSPMVGEISDKFGDSPTTAAAMDPRLLRVLTAPAHNLDLTYRQTALEACVARWLCVLDGDKEARCSRIERVRVFCEEQFKLIDQRLTELGANGSVTGMAESLAADLIKRLEELESTAQAYDIGAIFASGALATKDLHPLKTWRARAEGPLDQLLEQGLSSRLAAAEQSLASLIGSLTLSHPDQHKVKQQLWRLIGPSVVAYVESCLTPQQRQAAAAQPERLVLLQSLEDRVNRLEEQPPVLDLAQALDEPSGELLQQVALRLRPTINELAGIAATERVTDAVEGVRAANSRLDELTSKVTSLSAEADAHIRTRVDNEVALVSAGIRQDVNEQVRTATVDIQARVHNSTTELINDRITVAGDGMLASVLNSASQLVRDEVQLAADEVQATIQHEVGLEVRAQRVVMESNLRQELLATVNQEVTERLNVVVNDQRWFNRESVGAAVEVEVQVRMNAVHAQMNQAVQTAVASALAQHMAPYGQAINQLHDGMVQLAQQASASQHLGQIPQQIARMAQELGQQREAIGFTMGAVRASHQVVQEQLRNLSPGHSGYATPENDSPSLPTPSQLMFDSAELELEPEEGSGTDHMDESSLEATPTPPHQEGSPLLRLEAAAGAGEQHQLSPQSLLAHPLSLPSSRATSRVVTPVGQLPVRVPNQELLRSSRVPLPMDDDSLPQGGLSMQESAPLDLAEMRRLLQESASEPIVDSPDDSAPLPPVRRQPVRIEFSGERQPPLNPAWLRYTQPQNQVSSPQDITRLSPARGEGERELTQAAPIRRLDFSASVSVSPERSPREITRFVGAAHVVGSTAIDDGCTEEERAELAAWAAELAADQPPPMATVAQVSGAARPTDAAVRDGLLQAAEQLSEGAAAAPAVPQEGAAKQPKKAAKRNKDKKSSRADTSWPRIDPGLQPTATDDTIKRFVRGCYLATGDEVDQHEAFFRRRPTLVWLEQRQPATSLNIYTEDDTRYLTPPRVMLDSGADVVAIISQKIANAMQLTWTKGSVSLRGVGGTSAADGTTHQQVRIRLGGCTDEHSTPSPYEGCLSVLCYPVVCSPEFTQAIKADVILGQGFIRPCLGVMDLETERFSYAPAYMKHACKDFRVSVPCLMSAPKLLPLSPHKPKLPSGHTAGVIMVDHVDEAAAFPELEDMCDGPVSVVTVQANEVRKADAAAAKLSPGFHADGVPSREEHERALKAAAERNAADKREAEAIRAAQMSLVAGLAPRTLKPIGYVYSAEQIDRLNRSQPGGLLDVSGPTANEMVETERVARRVRAEYSEEFNGRIRTMETALADVSKKLAQLQGGRAAQPPSPPAPIPPATPAAPSQPPAEVQQVAPPASIDVAAPSSTRPVAAEQSGVQTRAQRNRANDSGAAVGAIARPVQRVSLSHLTGGPAAPVAAATAPVSQADDVMPKLDVQDDYA
jgi:hypothetical protein